MSKQLSFLATDRDEQDLRSAIDEIGFYAVPEVITTDDVPNATPVACYTQENQGFFFYLVPSECSPVEAFYRELRTDPSRSKLIPASSPVVEFAFCRRKKSQVFASRMYFNADKSAPMYEVASKKYDKLARFVRKWPSLMQPRRIYVGPETLQRARENAIELFDDHHRLQTD